jgi:hypothetical protein
MKPACLAGALVLASSCLAIAQVATLQIKVLEGDGATYAPGARSAQPLTVEIADDAGRAVAGAAVSFRLPEDGPSALFASGLRTEIEISDANGRATVRHLHVNATPGEFLIRVTANKDQAHAGTLVRQFIAGAVAGGAPEHSRLAKAKSSSKKWIVLAVLVAGVAGGVGAGVAARPSPPRPTSPPPVTVGPPTVSIGGVTWGR